jgi:cytidylate kinase
MIITIDGPAGAGKSSAARALAQRLGLQFLDTGAMYRAVAIAGLRRGVDWDKPEELARLAGAISIEVHDRRVLLNGEDVSIAIRTSQITALTRYAANNPGVRERLVELQRAAVAGGNFVTEGRDQGTVVFPHAECKIFLTASPEERARRRHRDLADRGENLSFEEVLQTQSARDTSDAERAVGPLVPAHDAIHLSTDGLSPGDVVDRLEAIVRTKCVFERAP